MNKKTVVIYKSKYGSTKRYAGWIALKLDADLYEVRDIRVRDLDDYDTIIYGGGLYIGKINGIKFLIDNYEKIKNKKIIVFAVGMESNNIDINKKTLDMNFDEDMINNINLFNFIGAFDYSKLNLIDKVLMKGLKSRISKKNITDMTDEDKIVLEGFDKLIDLCDKKSIHILVKNI
ncbi:flavodoxin domain-containing protein [Romboutsia sedimentorum]|uniref:Flavodoxin domain-containing protein n=1 Tax=Romboutsia sedimentorum TaxID=1368474 RepID=A0ABT7E870_9FIRM|nr:flavodoxin domain-containing protein [Romboutsia sedimentorum]MDK2563131.1 flavodoxin domain-containing protein [Romboutsia sedimentorum]